MFLFSNVNQVPINFPERTKNELFFFFFRISYFTYIYLFIKEEELFSEPFIFSVNYDPLKLRM